MKKTLLWPITWFMAFLLVFSLNSWGQVYETTFDVEANWASPDGGPMTGYNDKTYTDGDWLFESTEAVRGDAAESFGGSSYSFRDRGIFSLKNVNPVNGVEGFSFQLRDWMLGEGVDRDINISFDSGDTWETVITINKAWFNEYQVYQEYVYIFPEGSQDFDADEFQVQILGGDGSNNSRMNIGQFIALGEDEEPLPATVVDIIVGSDDHTTLAFAVTAAGLVETLQGEGPFTVFAPTDDAFAALPEGLLDDLLDDPEGLLTDILLYHVVGAFALSTDLEDGDVITALLGEDVVVTITSDGTIFINDAEVIIADLVADNGVVHVIDAVLVPEEEEPTTVVDIITESEIHTTLAAAVAAAGLVETLQGEGPFTVFAPTDEAFAALPEGLLDDLLDDPEGLLTDILLYHVVGAFALSADLEDGDVITTLLGEDVVVTITNGTVFINDAEVIMADLVADNGVVHVIDAVLVPEEEEEPTTVVDIILESEIHTTLAAAVAAAGLVETLQGEGPFTVFAPTDDAFAALPEGLLDDLLDDPEGLLTDILLYHVVGAFALSTDLEDGDVITTLLGEDVIVTITSNGTIFINDAEVIMADLVADNGVVHVIDAVLIPGEEPELVTCAFSQGYWFARPHTIWPYDVEVGGLTFTQEEGAAFWPPNTNTRRAFTQYSAIYLSGVTVSLFPELEDAMETIDNYFANYYPAPAGIQINRAAGFIGDWIDENHCDDQEIPEPETARVQLIHNAADMAAASVDVFVNGEIFIEDFLFRTATPFVDVPAGVELTIDIVPAGAGIENSVFDITVEFETDETYIIIANGIVSEEGYDPLEPFTVYPFAPALETGENADETDLLVFHGSTDAPEVSVWAMGGESELFTFEYGEFAGYLGLPTDDYVIEIRTADGETTVVAYSAPLATLELEGAALTVLASGFFIPENNSDGPAFGLFVATAEGGDLIPLPVYEEGDDEEPTTVVDIIVGSNDHTTLAAALDAAGLVEALQGEGPFTVFAPTDEAFAALPEGLLDDLLADPEGLLTDILLYHVVGAFALSTDLEDGQEITTLLGQNLVVTITNGSVFINDAEVILADLVADNGVVHVIDAVLVPEDEPEVVTCAFSQGYWFARPHTIWPYDVEVGGLTFTQEEGAAFWPPNTNTRRAFTQYSAIYLSGVTISLYPELEDAMETIDNYFANDYPAPAGIQINRAAGFIGNWINANHCEDYEYNYNNQNIFSLSSESPVIVYPNPFRTRVSMQFSIEESSRVKLEVYNLVGERIAVLFDSFVNEYDIHSVSMDADNLPDGIYFYRFSTESEVFMDKIILAR